MSFTKLCLSASFLCLMACAPGANTASDPAIEVTTDAAASKAKSAQASADKSKQVLGDDITSENLGYGIYRLMGPGGNIGVSVGDDGVFVIDDKFDRFADQILGQIRLLSDQPIKFVVNTHYHGDHAGANGSMKEAGAVIVAHDNVRFRMGMTFKNKLWDSTVEAAGPEQWPTLTYSETATFHFNGQTIEIIHTPSGHTDGDSIIYFNEANILHMGDNYFNGMFPYVDIDGGGSLQGMIASHNLALSLINGQTQVIPGHGPMATKADLTAARDVLVDIQNRVQAEINNGRSLEDIISAKALSDYADFAAFIDEEKMIRIAHRSLSK